MATSIKISQLPAKGSALEATDLLEVSEFNGTGYVSKSITGQEIIDSVPASVTAWGTITGTLSAQTDLQTALNAKVTGNTAITGATKTKVTYDSKGLVTAGADATTADIADSTNKRYVTDANLTVIGNTSGTNTGDQTLAGLGGVPTSRTISTTGPLSGGGDLSADRTLSIAIANTTTTGALSSTDWNTFNGKQSALVSGTNIKTINSTSLLGSGDVAVQPTLVSGTNIKTVNGTTILGSGDLTISTGITIGTTAITSGTVGRVLFEGTGNVVQESANLFWDNTNGRLGVGTSSPLDKIHLATNVGGTNTIFRLSSAPNSANIIYFNNQDGTFQGSFLATGTTFSYGTFQSNQTNLGGGTGGVGIRTTNGANAHIRFYSGNADNNLSPEIARFSAPTGNLLINTTTDAGFKLDVNGTARVQTSAYFATTSGNVGIGTASPSARFAVLGSGSGQALIGDGGFGGDYVAMSFNGALNTSQFNFLSSSGADKNLYINRPNGFAIYFRSEGTYHMIINSTGNVGIGTNSPNASSLLDLTSTTRGFLPPRMTTTQKNAIATPAEGLQVWDTTLKLMSVYNGTAWITL